MKTIENRNDFISFTGSRGVCAVDFYADWCSHCVSFKPVFSEAENRIRECRFAFCNVDQNSSLAEEHHIDMIPCILLYRDGVLQKKHAGPLSPEKLDELIRSAF